MGSWEGCDVTSTNTYANNQKYGCGDGRPSIGVMVLSHTLLGVVGTYYTLEREYRRNERYCSSIPADYAYHAHVVEDELQIRIEGVPDRTGIMIHVGGHQGAYCASNGCP